MSTTDRAHAMARDADDSLSHLRSHFHVPSNGANSVVYLCGHSLGLQPRKAADRLQEELEAWRRYGVEGHFHGARPWVSYHEHLTPGLAALSGARPIEVVAMNSLTTNLHLLLASFYRPTRERHKILVEHAAFPSDRYAVASQIQWHGFAVKDGLLEVDSAGSEFNIDEAELCKLIERRGQEIAVILLPGVQYLSGQVLDCERIARVAREQGCVVGFDLAHAIGNIPLALHDWNVDFAVWCSYKYLNGGPGAIGGCFVHERHAHAFDLPRLAGWWGHDKTTRFEMPADFQPLPGAEGWQVSNPSVFAAAPLLASLEVFQSVGLQPLREKSIALTGYLEALLRERLPQQVDVLTPHRMASRGCQLSLRLKVTREDAKRVHANLNARGIVCDWREPDVIRVAPVPLYNRFCDVWDFVNALAHELRT